MNRKAVVKRVSIILCIPLVLAVLMTGKIYIESLMEIEINEYANVLNLQDKALVEYYKKDYFLINLFRVIGPNRAEDIFNHRDRISNLCSDNCFTTKYINIWNKEAVNLHRRDINFFYLLTRFHPSWTPRIGEINQNRDSHYNSRQVRWMSEFKGQYWQPDIKEMDFLSSQTFVVNDYVIAILARHHTHWNPSRTILDKTLVIHEGHYRTRLSIAEMLASYNKHWTTSDPELLGKKVRGSYGNTIAWFNLDKNPNWLPEFDSPSQERQILMLPVDSNGNTIAHQLAKVNMQWSTHYMDILALTNDRNVSVAEQLNKRG